MLKLMRWRLNEDSILVYHVTTAHKECQYKEEGGWERERFVWLVCQGDIASIFSSGHYPNLILQSFCFCGGVCFFLFFVRCRIAYSFSGQDSSAFFILLNASLHKSNLWPFLCETRIFRLVSGYVMFIISTRKAVLARVIFSKIIFIWFKSLFLCVILSYCETHFGLDFITSFLFITSGSMEFSINIKLETTSYWSIERLCLMLKQFVQRYPGKKTLLACFYDYNVYHMLNKIMKTNLAFFLNWKTVFCGYDWMSIFIRNSVFYLSP